VAEITATLERGVPAMRARRSQIAHLTDLEKRMHEWSSGRRGPSDGRRAEAFQVVLL
jgi:hypothetical protein